MSKVLILKGLPASGKSTWAKKAVEDGHGDWIRVSRDDLRWMMHQYKFSNTREKMVVAVRNFVIEMALLKGKNVIVDETSLNPKTVAAIESLCKSVDPKVEIEHKFFEKGLQECIQDDRARPNSVGEGVIRRMYNQFIAPHRPPVTPDPGKPWAILCDLDGTIADIRHRDPYDGGKCLDDKPRGPVVELVRHYIEMDNHQVVFVSARDDEHFDKTLQWLRTHVDENIDGEHLVMRKTGDRRDDAIVKEEILRGQILPKWNVKAVIDDRPKVIRMWRDVGLFVFDVGDGIEF